MYVACPSCKSVYRIQPAHLRAAGGELRCGNCGEHFNAAAAVFEDARRALEHAERQHTGVTREIDDLVDRALGQVAEQVEPAGGDQPQEAAGQAFEQDQLEGEPETEPETEEGQAARAAPHTELDDAAGQQAGPAAAHADDSAEAGAVEEIEIRDVKTGLSGVVSGAMGDEDHTTSADVIGYEPGLPASAPELQAGRDFYAQPASAEFIAANEAEAAQHLPPGLLLEDHKPRAVGWGSIFTSMLLIVLLCGQLVWQYRYPLAQVREWRPLLERFCGMLQCDLPLRRVPAEMEMVEREVRDHPVVDGALLINASFVNRASFPQAYPVFQVAFSNVSGTPVALRRFAPAEYLQDIHALAAGMQPGAQVRVSLEVLDPGTQAVSFQFEFF